MNKSIDKNYRESPTYIKITNTVPTTMAHVHARGKFLRYLVTSYSPTKGFLFYVQNLHKST